MSNQTLSSDTGPIVYILTQNILPSDFNKYLTPWVAKGNKRCKAT